MIYGVLGLIFGFFGVLLVATQFLAPIAATEMIIISIMFLLTPIINIIIGFISGVIIAHIFNFTNRYTDGLKLEVQEIETYREQLEFSKRSL